MFFATGFVTGQEILFPGEQAFKNKNASLGQGWRSAHMYEKLCCAATELIPAFRLVLVRAKI